MRVPQPQTYSPDQPGKYGDYLSLLRPQEVGKALNAIPGRKADKIFPTSTGSPKANRLLLFVILLFQPTSTNVFSGFLKTGFFTFFHFLNSEQFPQRLIPYQTQDTSKGWFLSISPYCEKLTQHQIHSIASISWSLPELKMAPYFSKCDN